MPRIKQRNNEVIINLDKPRSLRFDLNAMAAYEDTTGKSAFAIGDNLTATSIRALLWSCLIHEDDKLKVEDVGSLIHAGNMQEITTKINQLVQTSTDTGEEAEENPNDNRQS
jgi:hypothetical protein